ESGAPPEPGRAGPPPRGPGLHHDRFAENPSLDQQEMIAGRGRSTIATAAVHAPAPPRWILGHGRTVATAWAAVPASRPMPPRRSIVVAFTLMLSWDTPSTFPIAARIALTWGASRGDSAITTTSTCTASHPRRAMISRTCAINSRLFAPAYAGSVGGK